MKLEQIKEAIEQVKEDSGFEFIGIRTQDEPFELGGIDHLSHVWEDGDDTGEELNGISATNVNSPCIKMHSDEADWRTGKYLGKHCAIIAGNHAERGEDAGEIIIVDAVVVEILR